MVKRHDHDDNVAKLFIELLSTGFDHMLDNMQQKWVIKGQNQIYDLTGLLRKMTNNVTIKDNPITIATDMLLLSATVSIIFSNMELFLCWPFSFSFF